MDYLINIKRRWVGTRCKRALVGNFEGFEVGRLQRDRFYLPHEGIRERGHAILLKFIQSS